MDTHTCISHDGITYTCPICGRVYQLLDGQAIVTNPGNPDAMHTGAWGATVKSVDATVPAGPARPEIFSRN